MIPSDIDVFNSDSELEEETEPSLTYRMDMKSNRIVGFVDDVDAVRQSIYKILNTERYDNPVYSWNYGFEVKDLYGEDDTFVIPELERRIIDALSVDDRIVECSDFDFEVRKKDILVKFTASTIYGDVDIEQGVDIDV